MSGRNNKGQFAKIGRQHIDDRPEDAFEALKNDTFNRFERSTFYNPTKHQQLVQYKSWLEKQARQMKKTFELDGVTHSRERKEQLKEMETWYMEEAKRIADKIEDGGR